MNLADEADFFLSVATVLKIWQCRMGYEFGSSECVMNKDCAAVLIGESGVVFSRKFQLTYFTLYSVLSLTRLSFSLYKFTPPNSETVRLNCIKGYWDKLHPGDEFHFGELRKFRSVCKAIWRDKDGIWMAFEPVRDRDYRHVYSSVREDGFYISYDQSNWKIVNSWTG
ncbi:hypothetical protein Patl1_26242 [Pistacia atlantica]|uniref:Uncharacterized protein n=1 Tax=Pistacia atlantica TaxID=434234 RepID=A0ACC1B4E1_9ROSI|nr:hypothetical protein Patl1_26242 [Pistacia atlantica]